MADRKKAIYQADAIRLLEDGRQHRLRLWKMSTGEILTYATATCIGGHKRRRTHRVRLAPSGQIREFRDIMLFEIDGKTIYL